MKIAARHVVRITGLILFGWILTRSDLKVVQTTILQMDLLQALGALLMFYPILWIKSRRWASLLGTSTEANLTRFRFYTASHYAGSVTPGRLGEFSRIAYARQLGAEKSQAVFAVLADKTLDLATLAVLAFAGIVAHVGVGAPAVGAAAAAGVLLWLLKRNIRTLFGRIFKRITSEFAPSRSIQTAFKGDVLTCTTLAWSLCVTQVWLLANALGIQMPGLSLVGGLRDQRDRGRHPRNRRRDRNQRRHIGRVVRRLRVFR